MGKPTEDLETMPDDRKKPSAAPGRRPGRPRANPDGRTFDFRATLDAIARVAPDLDPTMRQGVSALKAELRRADETVNGYLRGRLAYPSELPPLLIARTGLAAEGMAIDDLFEPSGFLRRLASSREGQDFPDRVAELLRRWRRSSPAPDLNLKPRTSTTLLRTCDPSSALQLDPGPYWLTLDSDAAARPFHLLLLEHDEKRREWLCMNKHLVSELRISDRHDRLERIPVHLSAASGRCTIYAVFSSIRFGHRLENLVGNLIGSDAVMTPMQLGLLLEELKAARQPGRPRQLAVSSLAYEVPSK